jgi:hypothetical protein
MTLVDSNVEGSLSTFVAGIQIGTSMCQQFHHTWFITKCCMMHSTITIFVLRNKKCIVRDSNNTIFVRSEVLSAANMKIVVFWDVRVIYGRCINILGETAASSFKVEVNYSEAWGESVSKTLVRTYQIILCHNHNIYCNENIKSHTIKFVSFNKHHSHYLFLNFQSCNKKNEFSLPYIYGNDFADFVCDMQDCNNAIS